MRNHTVAVLTAVFLALLPVSVLAGTTVEKIKNEKVLVTEHRLAPGESESIPGSRPSMLVYLTDGAAEITPGSGSSQSHAVKEGETVYQPAVPATVKDAGQSPLGFVLIEFLTAGSPETWGTSGLSPNYKLLLENRYGRAYDIRIPSQTREPQHTHHDRVVVALSGAQLEHILPSGKIQPSTLKTGEVVWRLGGTHIGHNMGTTDLWVIAVEPK